ncbi:MULTISPECIES: hypothetical protein [unclassified Roseovarius]|uniref:hypothetical protein n=1 Tax=unclassified Roseovarius TaxID=2614913 RepID=UPI00273EAEA7|nr:MULTISPECIES: hypothetical protein [unclassified Roseovarius]
MRSTSHFSAAVSEEHRKAAKVLGFALHLGDFNSWVKLSGVWSVRLKDEERAAIAYAALKSLPPHQAELTAGAVLPEGAGMPQVALFSEMDQAAHWADLASEEELDAYCLAAFNRMHADRQLAFLDHVTGRKAA